MKTLKILILRLLAKYISRFFSVNVYKHPEFLTKKGTYCHRNYLVMKIQSAIFDLIKDL